MSEYILAPERVAGTVKRVLEQISRLQTEIQAIEYGARLALSVPDDYTWTGDGWRSPAEEQADGNNT